MLRSVKTVRVAIKEEPDAALAEADQVTVKDDDERSPMPSIKPQGIRTIA